MKKVLIGVFIVTAVGLAILCRWQYRQAQNSATALSEMHVALEAQKQQNANLATKVDELIAQLEAAQTELQQTKTALKAADEAAKKAQEEALKEAEKALTDKASSSSTVSKPTPPKPPAKPTTPGGTNGSSSSSKPKPTPPANSKPSSQAPLTDKEFEDIFGGPSGGVNPIDPGDWAD